MAREAVRHDTDVLVFAGERHVDRVRRLVHVRRAPLREQHLLALERRASSRYQSPTVGWARACEHVERRSRGMAADAPLGVVDSTTRGRSSTLVTTSAKERQEAEG